MPIKRAKSKKRHHFRFLDWVYRKDTPKQKAYADEAQNLEIEFVTATNQISPKKIPDESNPRFWPVIVGFLEKDLIRRVIANGSTRWKKGFLKECRKRHEGNNYTKKR